MAHRPTVDDQSGASENHGDRKTRQDPNALGPVMSVPYTAVSPKFEDSNGFDQTWNEQQDMDAKGYPRRSYPA